MKINDKVKFWIDKEDIQYYPEKIEGIIIKNKGLLLAQEVYKSENDEIRGDVFDISKRGIDQRIYLINNFLKKSGISIKDFNRDLKYDNLNYFFDIEVIKNNT